MKNIKQVVISGEVIHSDHCLHKRLGEFIDIVWVISRGTMELSHSYADQYAHEIKQDIEYFYHIPFKHSQNCPFNDQTNQKNLEKQCRPCSVVMIQLENKTILATLRPMKLSFGGKWVMPGGHLQPKQRLFQGGIRECKQEVGLKQQNIKNEKIQHLMAWESVFMVNKEIKATAIVLFFKLEAQKFEVVAQKEEVESFQWRSIQNEQQTQKAGWAEGHKSYIKYVKQQESKKII